MVFTSLQNFAFNRSHSISIFLSLFFFVTIFMSQSFLHNLSFTIFFSQYFFHYHYLNVRRIVVRARAYIVCLLQYLIQPGNKSCLENFNLLNSKFTQHELKIKLERDEINYCHHKSLIMCKQRISTTAYMRIMKARLLAHKHGRVYVCRPDSKRSVRTAF